MKKQVELHLINKTQNKHPKWKDIKHIEFQDEDEIRCEWVEPYYSDNNSWEGHYSIEVTRMVDETDEQEAKRLKMEEWDKERHRRNRYEQYLKLKKEFENE